MVVLLAGNYFKIVTKKKNQKPFKFHYFSSFTMMVHRKSFRGSCPMLCTVETKEERILKTPRVELLRVDVFDKLVLCIEQQGRNILFF